MGSERGEFSSAKKFEPVLTVGVGLHTVVAE